MSRISRNFAYAFAALCAAAGTASAGTQGGITDRYVFCSFRPQAPSCGPVYRQALQDQSPAAAAVKAAYDGYGRYVVNAKGALTADDRQFLAASAIRLPDLTPQDQAGLHAVINDPALSKDAEAKRVAVNNFLSRAVQAELYCGFNSCNEATDLIS